jgi:hypothetical protein
MAMQPIQPMTGSPYGGVRSLRMTAPQAPSGTVQGQALSGQNRVVDGLTMQAQQTMGVPATPVKGLLKRMNPMAQGVAGMNPAQGRANYVRPMG